MPFLTNPKAEEDKPASKLRDDASGLSREAALERLARHMYESLEHLDPSDDRGWIELSERERTLYYYVVMGLIDRRSLIIAALQK